MAKANESRQVRRAREKLKKNLEIEHQKFTTESLNEMAKKIRSSIVRHHSESFLKTRKFTLFDENSHTAKTRSKQILKLQGMLQSSSLPFNTETAYDATDAQTDKS